jgi:hypothetical protein
VSAAEAKNVGIYQQPMHSDENVLVCIIPGATKLDGTYKITQPKPELAKDVPLNAVPVYSIPVGTKIDISPLYDGTVRMAGSIWALKANTNGIYTTYELPNWDEVAPWRSGDGGPELRVPLSANATAAGKKREWIEFLGEGTFLFSAYAPINAGIQPANYVVLKVVKASATAAAPAADEKAFELPKLTAGVTALSASLKEKTIYDSHLAAINNQLLYLTRMSLTKDWTAQKAKLDTKAIKAALSDADKLIKTIDLGKLTAYDKPKGTKISDKAGLEATQKRLDTMRTRIDQAVKALG